MKKLVLFSIFLALGIGVRSQDFGYIYFDDTTNLSKIYIDSTLTNNIWQIGHPQKSVFSSALSQPNSIVTDTLNPVLPNDTSVFYLSIFIPFWTLWEDFSFAYKMDCDTLTSYGKVEISLDTGKTYHNALNFGLYSIHDQFGNIVNDSGLVFTGRTNGWYGFSLNPYFYPDALLLFRFSFISNNSLSSRDGWLIDNIYFEAGWEGVPLKSEYFTLYPNPGTNSLHIESTGRISDFEIINESGQSVSTQSPDPINNKIDISFLKPGIYFLKVRTTEEAISIKKFIKIK